MLIAPLCSSLAKKPKQQTCVRPRTLLLSQEENGGALAVSFDGNVLFEGDASFSNLHVDGDGGAWHTFRVGTRDILTRFNEKCLSNERQGLNSFIFLVFFIYACVYLVPGRFRHAGYITDSGSQTWQSFSYR